MDEKKVIPINGFSPKFKERIEKQMKKMGTHPSMPGAIPAGMVKPNAQGQIPMPAEVYASLTALVNAALRGQCGQMEIGTKDSETGEEKGKIRILAIPGDWGEVKDGKRIITVPEVFGEVRHVQPPPMPPQPEPKKEN